MMKGNPFRQLAGFVAVLSLTTGAVAATSTIDLAVSSKITEVMVYPGAARITRLAKVDLAVGPNTVKLTDIIPEIDENSITVSGQGTALVKIHGATVKKEYLTQEADQKVQELASKIEALDDQIAVENGNQQTIQRLREFLNSVNLFAGQQVPKELVTVMPSAEKLGDTVKFLSEQLGTMEKRSEEIRLKIRELQREKEKLNRELAVLRNNGSNKVQRSIVVDLECERPGTLNLNVSYLVGGANWRPVYDARAIFGKEEVELTSFAVIAQTTGEDWEDVQLTLSTARPTIGGRMPYVSPWVLQENQPAPARRGMMLKAVSGMAMDQAAGAPPMVQSEAFSNVEKETIAEEKAEMAFSQVAQTGIAVTYKISRPVMIKSDGTETKAPMATQLLKADFEYSSFPRATPFAYLGSRVINAKDLQLLAGQVNLFLDGEFVGKSSIDNIGPAESFDLYLGVDENLKVTREQISKKMDDVLVAGIPSPTRRTTFTYKLTVENHKSTKSKVLLFEAMPVSENERIKVKIYDVSVPATQQDWKDRKGVWLWQLPLEPNAKKEIFYTFSVEHPRDMRVDGI